MKIKCKWKLRGDPMFFYTWRENRLATPTPTPQCIRGKDRHAASAQPSLAVCQAFAAVFETMTC